jgi:hypothetical protein
MKITKNKKKTKRDPRTFNHHEHKYSSACLVVEAYRLKYCQKNKKEPTLSPY